jgi:hypothetical protein
VEVFVQNKFENSSDVARAILNITGGCPEPTEILAKVCKTRPETFNNKSIDEDQKILTNFVETVVGYQLPEELGIEYWKDDRGKDVLLDLQQKLTCIPDRRIVK